MMRPRRRALVDRTFALLRGDEGMVVAEFAITLPAVVRLLAVVLGSAGVGAQHVQVQDAAANAARMLGRGEPASAALALATRVVRAPSLDIDRAEGLVCVTLRAPARIIVTLPVVQVRGYACALDDGLSGDIAR